MTRRNMRYIFVGESLELDTRLGFKASFVSTSSS
jgi:hypothetical protein